jgi:hypothetical protein
MKHKEIQFCFFFVVLCGSLTLLKSYLSLSLSTPFVVRSKMKEQKKKIGKRAIYETI